MTLIDQDFIEATAHHFSCRCFKCIDWWVAMGAEDGEPDQWGPFTTLEVRARCEALGVPFRNGFDEDEDAG